MRYGAAVGAAILLLAARPVLADVDPAVLKAEDQRVAAMAKARPGVLAVFSPTGAGGGSGVVITPDGFALTNFHVVKPCGNAMKCGMPDGKLYDAVVVGLDPTGDVALIKLFGRDDFPAAELGDSDEVQMGDWCFAMGNPFLLATDFQPTVTYGIVSGTHRYQPPAGSILEYTDCIQTDASINPGNSGGPLFDAQGRLIGINGRGSFEKRGRVNVGVGYAISINQIKNFMGHLHSGRIVDHATLGASVAFDAKGRVAVANILESSDAFRRGLQYDDEVVGFAGRPITTPNHFKNVLGIYPKGWRVPLSFVREDKKYDVLVRLAGVHRTEELIELTEGRQQRQLPMPLPKPEPKPGEKPKDGESKPAEKPKDGETPKPADPKPADSKPTEPKPPETKPAETKPAEAKPAEAKPAETKPAEKPKEEPKPVEKPREEPKPAEAKPADKPAPGQPRIERIPMPKPGDPHHPMMPMRAAAPMPEIVKKHFEAKPGYANYYFNRLHRDRVLKAWTARGDYAGLAGPWTLSGKLDTGTKFDVVLTNGDAVLKLPNNDFKWTATSEMGASLEPQHSGGMLPALHLWRRLAVLGAGRFGDVSYLGTAPMIGRPGLVDVLVGVFAGVECRYMFDPTQGHLLGMEFFADDNADPCEVYFSDYRENGGRWLPEKMEVRYGDEIFGVFTLTDFRFDKGEWPEESPPKEKEKKDDAKPAPSDKPDPEKKEGPEEAKPAEKEPPAAKPAEGKEGPEKPEEKPAPKPEAPKAAPVPDSSDQTSET